MSRRAGLRAGAIPAVVASAAVVGVLSGCGGGSTTAPATSRATARPSLSLTGARVIPRLVLPGGTPATLPLPAGGAVISFDVRLAPRAALDVESGSHTLRVSWALPKPAGWLGGAGSHHVEIADGRVAVDGRAVAGGWPTGGQLVFRQVRWSSTVTALIVSPASESAALLLHRLAELHARIPPRRFPVGTGADNRIVYRSTYWTSGFWPGALWGAAALEPAGGMFSRWALQATIGHFGQERAATHDVGFMYGESSLAAWRALCAGATAGASSPSLCARLRRSTLSAADELLALAASNHAAGTIPTGSTGTQSDTIVDSLMNVALLLPWASQVTGNRAYASLAARHARKVAALLVRPDGSTTQSINFDRATGRVLFRSTHQGLSDASTWSRGQGWAVYGFAALAGELHDRSLLRVALRAAGYVASHLPGGGVPRWDYDAPAGAPVDVSAGVITAAGLFHLAAACGELPGVCPAGASARWSLLGRRMLSAALGHASSVPPLGLLADQVLNERGRGCWCNGGELIFGLTFGLEAVRPSA